MAANYFTKYAALLDEVRAFNQDQVFVHGTTPEGVGWNGLASQTKRFEQVLKVLDIKFQRTFTLNDIGCGYGALLDHLPASHQNVDYRGYEVSETTLTLAQKRHPISSTRTFKRLEEISPAHYSVASGIFALRFLHSEDYWQEYVFDTLDLFHENSDLGFSFNMLTSYSDASKIKPELFYANPCVMFDFCKRRYSRNVALYHDYSLYDFTIVVRKES